MGAVEWVPRRRHGGLARRILLRFRRKAVLLSDRHASGLPSSQYHRFGKGDGPAVEKVPTPSFPEQRAILGLPPPVEASKKKSSVEEKRCSSVFSNSKSRN